MKKSKINRSKINRSKINRFAVFNLQLAVILLLIGGQAWADTKKITGTTNIEDAMIWEGETYWDKNYGDMGNGDHVVAVGRSFLIRVKNVASELGEDATISACVCSVYCWFEVGSAKWVRAYRVFKPWVEGTQNGGTDEPGVTWNDWDNDDWEWTLAGCECANDDGVDNSADNGACDASTKRDRKATQESLQSIDATGWFVWSVSADLAQDWYDGTANENGIILHTGSSGSVYLYGSEHSTTAPHWTFTYTTGAPPEVDKPRKNIMKGGTVK